MARRRLEKFLSVLTMLSLFLKSKGGEKQAMFRALWKLGMLPSTTAGNSVEPFRVTQVSLLEQQQ